jgi:hypothetical protein
MPLKFGQDLITRATLALLLVNISDPVIAECNAMLKAHGQPSSQTVSDNKQLIIDSKTALMWMRCSIDQSFSDATSTCEQSSTTSVGFNWAEALVMAEAHEFGGFSDWRLPNRKELDSIVDRSCYDPAVNEGLFPGVSTTNFWTNSLYNFNVQFAWGIDFASGSHKPLSKEDKNSVLLVRSLK